MEHNEDRQKLDRKRGQAAQYLCGRYSREERHLIIMARDCEKFLESSDRLLRRETDKQYYWDFLTSFERLRELMSEYRWSKEFLASHGIDFQAVRKLYFAVA